MMLTQGSRFTGNRSFNPSCSVSTLAGREGSSIIELAIGRLHDVCNFTANITLKQPPTSSISWEKYLHMASQEPRHINSRLYSVRNFLEDKQSSRVRANINNKNFRMTCVDFTVIRFAIDCRSKSTRIEFSPIGSRLPIACGSIAELSLKVHGQVSCVNELERPKNIFAQKYFHSQVPSRLARKVESAYVAVEASHVIERKESWRSQLCEIF